MLSKAMIFVITAMIVGGTVAGVTMFYIENSNQPKVRMNVIDYNYFFGPDPENLLRNTTYVYLKLSNKLLYNDFIHIHYGPIDLARWWVNKSQAYRSDISIPLNVLTNLNGSLDIEIMRGNTILYSGKLVFSTNVNVAVRLFRISYCPLNYRFADLRNATV